MNSAHPTAAQGKATAMSTAMSTPMTSQDKAIVLSGLSFAWPQGVPCVVIDDFSLARGARLFIHGPSGCGKSSLLGLLTGVLQPQQGQIHILGKPLHSMTPKQRDTFRGEQLGYLFQQFNLLPYLSAFDNVSLPARMFASRHARATQGGSTLRQAILNLCSHLDLSPATLQQHAHQLSVGQQQRVAAARALLGAPPLLIADEPTSALDAGTQARFMELLLSAASAHGTTVVMVSHDQRLASHFDVVLSLPDINRAQTPRNDETASHTATRFSPTAPEYTHQTERAGT